jgi:hypothetical protein
MNTFGKKAFSFYRNLRPDFKIPEQIDVLMPFENKNAEHTSGLFYNKFYDDNRKRIFIVGINPGRFGAGTTGIAFTDPIRLETKCGITNELPKKPELSSVFIYEMIDEYGGVNKFYSDFFLTAICPVGFIRNGNNINYYDDNSLANSVKSFIVRTLGEQMAFGAIKSVVICLGEGKNYKYLMKINEEHHFFEEIIPLSHPRFIMQYRRKKLKEYLGSYIDTLNKSVEKAG